MGWSIQVRRQGLGTAQKYLEGMCVHGIGLNVTEKARDIKSKHLPTKSLQSWPRVSAQKAAEVIITELLFVHGSAFSGFWCHWLRWLNGPLFAWLWCKKKLIGKVD